MVNPTNPQAEDICLEDIAWGLSRIPRFAGHTITEIPYNVAQHSVYVSTLVEQANRSGVDFSGLKSWPVILDKLADIHGQNDSDVVVMFALLHDAHETYLGDIPSPVKKVPELHATFKLMEQRFDHAIRGHFGLPEPSPEIRQVVHYFDKLAQAIEGYQFMRSRGVNWKLPVPTLAMLQKFPAPMTAFQSYQAFLERYDYLRSQ